MASSTRKHLIIAKKILNLHGDIEELRLRLDKRLRSSEGNQILSAYTAYYQDSFDLASGYKRELEWIIGMYIATRPMSNILDAQLDGLRVKLSKLIYEFYETDYILTKYLKNQQIGNNNESKS